MNIQNLAEEQEQYIIDARRYLHQNPEVGLHEKNTSEFIQKELDSMGIPYETVDYGVIALIEGKNKDNMVALRADIVVFCIIAAKKAAILMNNCY